MNSKRFLRKTFLSILLVTAILLGSFSSCLTVYAVEASGDVLAELGAADTGLTVEKLVLSEDDVPEVIDFAEAQEKGHVLRLRSKESDDNTVVFLNDDNTETMYLFAEPVKYTDEHGNIKDKSTALSLESDAYTMAQNDVKVRFARDISKGVTVNKGGVNITMTPVSTTVNSGKLNADSNAELVSVNENKITYSNVFQSAGLVYTTLYSGFKEDIVLESYDGINEFAFIVNTNGLYPVKQENGAVYFFEPNTDELVAKMMQVVCYDSAYNFAEGDVRITEVKANQIYGFTVVADSAFLTDEDTVYPVYVDPTITLNTESTIEDAVVYSGKPTRNYGDYSYLNVGYVDDTYKLGYMMIRFPTLANHSTFASLANSDINSATLTIYTASGGSGTEVLRLFTAASEWTESTVTYSTVPNTPPPVQFGQMTAPSGGGAPTNVVLTDTVKLWAQGATYTTPSKGIYILNGNSTDATQCRDFLSVEYALSSSSREQYMPKLVINYGTTTNTVSIVLEDDDDVDNGKIELKAGRSDSFIAKLYYNGNLISGGTLLTFQSLETSVADIPTATVATVRGISVGTAAIRATYSGQPRATADIIINVWEQEVVFKGDLSYTYNIHNEPYCDINSYIIDKGVVLENDANITYEFQDANSNIFNLSKLKLSNKGVVTLKDTSDECFGHPAGSVKVRATYTESADYYDITLNVVCNDYAAPITMNNCVHIHIDYPTPDEVDDPDIPTLSGFNVHTTANLQWFLAEKYDNSDLNYIEDNFSFDEEQWLIDAQNRRFFELIRSSENSIVMTHGQENGSFVVNCGIDNDDGLISVSATDILALPQGYFNECELIVLLCCYGGDYNLYDDSSENSPAIMSVAQAFADRGAKRVVTLYDSVDEDVALEFVFGLFGYMAFTTHDSITYRNEDVTPTYLGAIDFAVGYAFENNYTKIDSNNNVNAGVTALDGTELREIVYKVGANRVATMIGDGGFEESVYES